MPNPFKQICLGGFFVAALSGWAAPAQAQSLLDTDPLCIRNGCVVIYDGTHLDIYDTVDPATGVRLTPGEPLIRRVNNPFAGPNPVGPFITGTLTPASTVGAPVANGNFGFDQTGDGVADIRSLNDTDGVLDASDVFDTVTLNAQTTLVVGDDIGLEHGLSPDTELDPTLSRSLFISSRGVAFDLVAEAVPNAQTPLSALNTMAFSSRIRTRGNNAGLRFGQRSQPRAFERITDVSTLADIAGAPAVLFRASRSIRRRAANTINLHVQRFDYTYGTQSLDPSIPRGTVNFQIEFDLILR